MAASNEFLPYATDASANVEAQASYAVEPALSLGQVAGFARSAFNNKVFRQAVWASVLLGEVTSNILDDAVVDDGDLATAVPQLMAALLTLPVFTDTGSVNAIVVVAPGYTLPAANTNEMVIVKIAATNTSTTVNLNLASHGNIRVKKSNGNDPAVGDLVIGQYYPLVYNGTNWRVAAMLVSDIIDGLNLLPALPASGLTVFVRSDGNNSNNGLTNSSGGAFQTIQGAFTALTAAYTLAGNRQLTITIGLAGTYAVPTAFPVGSNVLVQGLTGAPASYILTGGSVDLIIATNFTNVSLLNLTLQNTATTHNWASAAQGGLLTLTNIYFTTTVGATSLAPIVAFPGGSVVVNSVLFDTLSVAAVFYAHGAGANITISPSNNAVITYSTSVASSIATAYAQNLGNIVMGTVTNVTGTVTGARYSAITNGVIDVSGQGASAFPGNSGGTTATGGQYV